MSARPPLPITVVIPAKNEEQQLDECLGSLDRFAKVVVVDSGSTDQTEAIARSRGAEILRFQWDGKFPKKRNWVLLTYSFATPWVLFLDADERVTPDFVAELERTLPSTTHDGFWLRYANVFMGRRLRHGPPMRKLALLRVGAGLYERIEEETWSRLDMEVHEHPVVSGTVGEIKSPLDHQDDRGLHAYIAKHNDYSTWEAARYVKLLNTTDSWRGFTATQRMKYRSLEKWWLAPAYFMYSYFWKLGFCDGRPGLAFAILKAIYFFQIKLKIRERRAGEAGKGSVNAP
jgi:glycosyltransferase involved in cell wall biosynthesis